MLLIFLLTLPAPAHADCTSPAGLESAIVYNSSYRVPQYCDGTNWIAMSMAQYGFQGVHFNGVTDGDYLSRGGNLTGVTATKQWSGSFWFRIGAISSAITFYDADNGSVNVRINMTSGGQVRFEGTNSAGTLILQAWSTISNLDDGDWHHVMWSFDLSDTAKSHIYIDGADETPTPATTYTDDLMGADGTEHHIMRRVDTPLQAAVGDIADFWLDYGTYIDLSSAANRRKFITGNGEPVYLGTDGSLPTGSAPDIFLSGDFATWATNDGTGGGFTVNGGGLTAAGWQDVTDGLVGHWKMDESSGNLADSTIYGNDGVPGGGPAYSPTGGKINGALTFDGMDDIVMVSHNGVLDSLDTITIVLWVKTNSMGEGNLGRLLNKSSDCSDFTTFVVSTNKYLFGASRWNTTGGTWSSPNNSIAFGTWQHVAVTYDYSSTANNATFYLDGTAVTTSRDTAPAGTALNVVACDLQIGNVPGLVRTFDGQMDDIRIYNRVLSEEEVMQVYAATAGKYGSCTGPYGLASEMIYNSTSDVMQYCDQFGWQAMGPVPGAGGAGCANPPGTAGNLFYNTSVSRMQYCDGANWIAIGK